MDNIWICLGKEDIRKGLIVGDGNLNAREDMEDLVSILEVTI